jgi:hypothetical protein
MTALTADASPAMDAGLRAPAPAQTSGPVAADRSPAAVRPGRTVRSWPLLVLAAPAAAEVWSGWVGIAQKTGFGLVSPLPGIWPSLHIDTAITLPVGVEAYAAYALRAWLASEHTISARTRRFAKWSAIFSFALGMAGQVAYHLLAQAGTARAPWPITTIVSCLPVLVLAMGTTLSHMLRADATESSPGSDATEPTATRSANWAAGDQGEPDQNHELDDPSSRPAASRRSPKRKGGADLRSMRHETDQARLVGRRLAAEGKLVSRRALRSGGVRGSNERLNALASRVNAELAGATRPQDARWQAVPGA